MKDRYSMVIRWSEEDQVFVVSLPEFGDFAQTHGDSYEEAAQNGREVLDLLVETFQAEGRALPAPQLYDGSCSESARRKP
jgi:predicted RNase H-like HicB family nuclease